VPISRAVHRYYAERLFSRASFEAAPPNFRPLAGAVSGRSAVEGCRGGGKNVLEVALRLEGDRVEDLRASCNLCNPAMYVAADVLCDWARGRAVAEVLALDPLRPRDLRPFFAALGAGGEEPEDAREKFQYALAAVQNAVRAARGEVPRPVPEFPEPGGLGPTE
jgi:hypothetical protein